MGEETKEHALAVQYPWQVEQWSQFHELQAMNRLPHAILLGGLKGVGKKRFAKAVAHSLLCEERRSSGPCGHCQACDLNQAGTHPDLKEIEPEQAGKQIKVDQVRGVLDFIGQTSQQGGDKVTIVSPAEAMNINAANALLKCLEEPTPNTLILLVSDSPGNLLPTIKSRCQLMRFPLPTNDEALKWLEAIVPAEGQALTLLKEARGRPLEALSLLESDTLAIRLQMQQDFVGLATKQHNALAIAEKWKDFELVDVLAWLQLQLSDLIRHQQAGLPINKAWLSLAGADSRQVFKLLDRVADLQLKVRHGANPNKQLALEDLMLQSCELLR